MMDFQNYNNYTHSFDSSTTTGGYRKGWHYWMYIIKDGRPSILGHRPTEAEALEYLHDTVPEYEPHVICLDTIDTHKASGMIKGRVLSESGDLDLATRRMVLKQCEGYKERKKPTSNFADLW